ncbi:MAG: hypothetical protein R2755_26865 [Acidimicrobiales bacterium]
MRELIEQWLTVRHIDTFYTAMSREEGLAASTVQLHNALFGSLDQAVKWGWRQMPRATR